MAVVVIFLMAFAVSVASASHAAQAQTPVDLELVLLVDASSSVNPQEFDLQMRGLATAFRDEEVHGAIQGIGDRGMAVVLVQWASQNHQVVAVDWALVYDPVSAVRFADAIDASPRYVEGGSTAVGSALNFAVRLLLRGPYSGSRQVIDLSGDGRSNQGRPSGDGRDVAVASGMTVNALAILNEDPNLDFYYRGHVIGGPGAFLLTALDYEDFARAIRMKLIREIQGAPLAEKQERKGRPVLSEAKHLEPWRYYAPDAALRSAHGVCINSSGSG